MAILIEGCQGCGACLLTCPEHALRPAAGCWGAGRPADAAAPGPVVLAGRCTGCGECLEICPVDAIRATEGSRT